ncbi:uncharacterized protein EV420DRAFT_1472947 [Desarmillaria tabescens]|uniref:Uncharacterized protein n=1 Tax=Armillaria tabescens TaxID=1929756 RepID=A0AA39U8S0_ARMTA|nr:uncharacterized protein EV420DRAFT_1472947 [Desarmillaria tabescens]KAK0469785.1 hypothetical protein EV420DRAFT_1472947 [Desarmillaria tabescens]
MAFHSLPAGYYPPQGPQRPSPISYEQNPPSYMQSNAFATPYVQQKPSPMTTPQYSYDPPDSSSPGRPNSSSTTSNPQTSTQSATSSMTKLFGLNEEVQVQIEGRRWVIGIIISVLSLFDRLGYGYRVKYASTNGRWKEGAFPVDHIQPRH